MEIRTETTTTPPPPPPPKPKPLSFTNGVLKKHPIYRECLKNHAASLGGHALDGCGEFMPSPTSSPADPTSLKCAACGCHRNFHRREPHHHQHHHHHHHEDMGPNSKSPSPPPYFPSAPQMLLALSTGVAGHDDDDRTVTRKRFRTKFSKDQKEKMLAFSERLGWKMQKKDEGMIEEFCNEVGVGKGVFKVWMHNNKHNLKRGELNNNNVDDQTNNNETHLMNGSSSSS